MKRENSEGALIQLRAYIAQGEFELNDRLPAERELCETLGRTFGVAQGIRDTGVGRRHLASRGTRYFCG